MLTWLPKCVWSTGLADGKRHALHVSAQRRQRRAQPLFLILCRLHSRLLMHTHACQASLH